MGFLGTRIELTFARAVIADVTQLGNFVSLSIVRPNQDPETLGFWTQDEGDAKKIVQALPSTVSPAGIALKEYVGQLKLLDRGDYVTKALVAANMELTRFSGHLMVSNGGVRDGEKECSIYAGV